MSDVGSDEKHNSLHVLKHCTGLRTPVFLCCWMYCQQEPWRQRANQLILKQKTERAINLLHQDKSQPLTLWVSPKDTAFLGPTQECMSLDGYINHLHAKLIWKVNFMYGGVMKSLGVRESPIAKRLIALEIYGRSFPVWISISSFPEAQRRTRTSGTMLKESVSSRHCTFGLNIFWKKMVIN